MIDFTKLRDLIVEKKCVSSSDYGKEDPFIGIYWEDLIDIINQCDSEKWISVDEALPPRQKTTKGEDLEQSIPVFVRDNEGNYTSAWYSFYSKHWFMGYGEAFLKQSIYSKITHWMAIPSLKGGEKW